MNIYKKLQKASIYFILFGLLLVGCKNSFLNEYNPATRTTATYYTTPTGYDGLVTSCYPILRDITQQRNLTVKGTDIFTCNGWGGIFYNLTGNIGNPLDQYDIRFNSTQANLQPLWDLLYREINRCNAVVRRAGAVVGYDPAKLAIRVAEGKFLRSLCLFMAVQQWGDIPMPLVETINASLDFPKSAAKDVYAQIITDLTSCVATLPLPSATDVGRATQGAAQFLLAKVYLTRGWNYNNSLGGTAADFTSSLQLSDAVIASGLYPLEANWNNLWPTHPKLVTGTQPAMAASVAAANVSKEVIWSIQYSNPAFYWGDGNTDVVKGLIGNNMHSQFYGGPSGVAQAGGTTLFYSKLQGDGNSPTWAAYRMFDPTLDTRYEGTFNSVSYATIKQTISLVNNTYSQNINLTYNIGDTTAIVLPWNRPVTLAAQRGKNVLGGTKNYSVSNMSEIVGPAPISPTKGVTDNMLWTTPLFWKFFQPGVSYNDGFSTFNDPLFRSAELYLMAAEAIVKGATGAKLGTADVYYNTVLDRALGTNAGKSPSRCTNPSLGTDPITNVVSYRATPGNITVDMILDESARELMGEGQRWLDLKRTNTLITRTSLYNPWTAFGLTGTPVISANNLVRPIPQGAIDVSSPAITQNTGY